MAVVVAVLTAIAGVAAVGSPGAEEYTIGPRDVVAITVWGQRDLSNDYTVDADGFVPFPLVGRIKAGGLTTKGLAAELRGVLGKDYLVDPQVIVSVKQYLSKKVYVLGEAEKRGVVYLKGSTTLLEALSEAGGLSKTAGKQLTLVRNHGADGAARGSEIRRLNVEKIQAGDAAENIVLQDEDMILVPKAHAFFVLGEVKNPGTFPLEKETSILDGITLAGGFNSGAAASGVKLVRRHADGKQETTTLDLSGPAPKNGGVHLQEGDTVLVPKGNTFFVFGEVKKPGAYQLEKDTNVLEGITIAGGFSDKAAPGRTRIIRHGAKGEEVIEIDMNEIIKQGRRDKAIPLRENDVVVVPESFF